MYEQYMNQFNPNGYVPQPFSQPVWSYQRTMPQGFTNVRGVDGLQEVQSCSTPLGTRTLFMDKIEQKFYVKETDFNNISTIKEYSYQEYQPAQQTAEDSNFVTKAEFDKWKEQYESFLRTTTTDGDTTDNSTVTANGTASTVSKNDKSTTGKSPSGDDDTERFSF